MIHNKIKRDIPENRACHHEYCYQLQKDSYEATDDKGGYRHYKCTICGAEYSYRTDPLIYHTNPKNGKPVTHNGASNPYLPGWEHVADAEPHVFWSRRDKEWRVYIYGSHDITGNGKYCGNNYVLWSAPVYDLSQWRDEGEIFHSEGVLFAPDGDYDVMTDTYYLVTYEFEVRIGLYRASEPQGYFRDRVFSFDKDYGEFGAFACIDPAIFIEHGEIYLGGTRIARFSTDLPVDVKQAVREYRQSMAQFAVIYKLKKEPSKGVEKISYCPVGGRAYFPVYEGVSIRKDPESGKYIMVYCSTEYDADGINPTAVTSTLSYAYADDLMGEWNYGNNGLPNSVITPAVEMVTGGNTGNVISDTGGRYRKNLKNGNMEYDPIQATYPYDNNHGGIARINGKWYVFSHRFTDRAKGARQGTIEKLEMKFEKESGKLLIHPTEMTSSGAADSICAYNKIHAMSACWLTKDKDASAYNGSDKSKDNIYQGPYIRFNNQNRDIQHQSCIAGISNGSVIGFKYLDFGENLKHTGISLLLQVTSCAQVCRIIIQVDSPNREQGEIVGEICIDTEHTEKNDWKWHYTNLNKSLQGVHAIYLIFQSDAAEEICRLDAMKFEARQCE